MKYPDVDQVTEAGIEDVLRWNRFLPSPRTTCEVHTMNAIIERMTDLRRNDPEAFSRASKLVGWGSDRQAS